VAEARNAVKTAQASFDAKLNSIEESVSAQWRKLQTSFDNQVAIARNKAAELKAAHNLADAKDRADYYEAYAEAAADFARLAAAEADAAMLQASEARTYAASLETTTA
jgi:aspartate oxidase